MKTYSNILVGVDFSVGSRAALKSAVRLGMTDGARITAIHVLDSELAQQIQKAHSFSETELHSHITARLDDFLKEAEVPEGLVHCRVEVGVAYEVLHDACLKYHAEVLMLGTRGNERGPNDIGTVAAKCVRRAPADVLLVREDNQKPFQHVLVCVDFSETSAKAVRHAARIALQEKAPMDCLFVHQSAIALSLDYGGFLPPLPPDAGESQNVWLKDLREFLAPLLRTSEGLVWNPVVLDRVSVRDAINEHIESQGSDLVVLGTRGKSGLRELFLGTTAERVVTHSPCSILAVKPDEYVVAAQAELAAAKKEEDDDVVLVPAGVPIA